ncbi:hypothetical protein B0T14DRAFT_533039 [Immersiella caudata]|uniref:Heterokaryon incompatibility domain-containing protein n=1 Tax=Immersiella caudata TaxID=314043 RepID=A0AA39XET1_9PEZI|nr:hypothetical protein B0T14DRAFT_533039 [Immersiella caudata]
MWLLNSRIRELRQFISDNDVPPYAILSYAWGDEGVTFDGWQALATYPKDIVCKRGYEQIDLTCQQAAKEELDWVWKAKVCYAYLIDVPFTNSKLKNERNIPGSRWFTRGWTLRGDTPLEDASIAKRMSWVASQSSPRTEDMVCCLLGLFDINMPLLYGEGTKAFVKVASRFCILG